MRMKIQYEIEGLLFFVTFISYICSFTNAIFVQSQTGSLRNYNGYSTVRLLHFAIPQDCPLAWFHLVPDNSTCSSIRDNVLVVIKSDSPAVINPTGSPFPDGFFNFKRPKSYFANISSETEAINIKLVNPRPGKYFLSAFLPSIDLRNERVDDCNRYLNVTFYVEEESKNVIMTIGYEQEIFSTYTDDPLYYKVFVPISIDHILLTINQNSYCDNCDYLILKTNRMSIGSAQTTFFPKEYFAKNKTSITLYTLENSWYYFQFSFIRAKNSSQMQYVNGSVSFTLKLINSIVANNNYNESNSNMSYSYYSKIAGIERDKLISNRILYEEYVTFMQKGLATFAFFYHLGPSLTPFSVRINSGILTSLPFYIGDLDVGGTIRIGVGVSGISGKKFRIIGCVGRDQRHIPVWPNDCYDKIESNISPITLNQSHVKTFVYLPYPEPGYWFATFRLFCDKCRSCNCSESCQSIYESCSNGCEFECDDSEEDCSKCTEKCRLLTLANDQCKNCDCEWGCLPFKNDNCNASIQIELVSNPCIDGSCGVQGSCVYSLQYGFALSTCSCKNNYRGWDCSDNKYTNPFSVVLLEYLLLTLSNLAFVPSAIVAFRKSYYIPCLMFVSVFIFSTLYHACDAGESIITYCILPFDVLQFADFFCAMVALWTTLVSIGYAKGTVGSIFYFSGTVALALGVRANMMSVWLYVGFALVAATMILLSWSFMLKVKKVFPRRSYLIANLPLGLAMLIVGLLLFSMSSKNNYKYFHSLWHIILALAVFVVLPRKNYFLESR